MIKLSELKGDTKLCYDCDFELSIFTKDELLNNLQEEDIGKVFIAEKEIAYIDMNTILDTCKDDMYEDWKQDMFNSIPEDKVKMINDIFEKACEANPTYYVGEEVELDCLEKKLND